MLGGGKTMKGRTGPRGDLDTRATTTARELVDIKAVALRLGVTVRHIRRLVAERRVPFVKWGHLLRFDPQEIDAWVDEHRREVRDEAPDTARAAGRSR